MMKLVQRRHLLAWKYDEIAGNGWYSHYIGIYFHAKIVFLESMENLKEIGSFGTSVNSLAVFKAGFMFGEFSGT